MRTALRPALTPAPSPRRFSLLELIGGITACSVVFAVLRSQGPELLERFPRLAATALVLIGLGAVILVASSLFLGAVLLSGLLLVKLASWSWLGAEWLLGFASSRPARLESGAPSLTPSSSQATQPSSG